MYEGSARIVHESVDPWKTEFVSLLPKRRICQELDLEDGQAGLRRLDSLPLLLRIQPRNNFPGTCPYKQLHLQHDYWSGPVSSLQTHKENWRPITGITCKMRVIILKYPWISPEYSGWEAHPRSQPHDQLDWTLFLVQLPEFVLEKDPKELCGYEIKELSENWRIWVAC